MSSQRTIAISGCGAVAERYYAPVLRELERSGRARVTALFDPTSASLGKLAEVFPRARRARSLDDMLGARPDLVIVASPPREHAEQAIAALGAGSAVLCEKPAATSSAELVEMEAAAIATARPLAIGMVRRCFPASRIVHDVLRRRALGAPRQFTLFEGGPFRWPVRSPAYFDREVSGGGVLADLGPHVLDLLTWWLGELALVRSADDAMGGVEANAVLELEAGGALTGVVRLSRDWQRPNELCIDAEHGRLRWQLEDLATVTLEHADGRTERLTGGTPEEATFLGCMAAEVSTVLDRLDGAAVSIVTTADAKPVVAMIEDAYARRSRMPMPWLDAIEGAAAP